MRYLITFAIVFSFFYCTAQTKNFIDQPYISVNGSADTFVTPNEIFIKITLSEKDTRDKISVEEQEAKLIKGLTELGINTETNLSVFDFGSNYRFYLLKKKDVIKTKQYTLKVADAVTVSKVFMKLEELELSNAYIDRVNHTEMESIRNAVKAKAIENAKTSAQAMVNAVHQTIGPAILISESNAATKNDDLVYRRLSQSGFSEGNIIEGKYKYETAKLEYEKIKISASVMVNFILK